MTRDLSACIGPGQGDPDGHGAAVPLAIHLSVAREDAVRHPARDILGEHAREFMLDRRGNIRKMAHDLWGEDPQGLDDNLLAPPVPEVLFQSMT